MAGPKTPQARNKRRMKKPPKPEMGESWVVESDGENETAAAAAKSTGSITQEWQGDDLGVDISGESSDAQSPYPRDGVGAAASSARNSVINPRTRSTANNASISRSGGNDVQGWNDHGSPTSGRPSSRLHEVPRRRNLRERTPARVEEPEFIMPSIREASSSSGPIFPKKTTRQELATAKSKRQPKIEDVGFQDKLARASEHIESVFKHTFGWIFDVMRVSLQAMKTPISYALTAYMLFGLMLLLRNSLSNAIYSALSPICRIPGASLLNLEICNQQLPTGMKDQPTAPAEFDSLMSVQSKFEEILEQSAGGVSLPLDMKRGETSIRDLRQVVRFSSIPSKNELVLEFDGFIETARMASYDLQRFNSHVGRAVDNILATARWTQRILDGIATRQLSRGALESFLADHLLAPFQPAKQTEDLLLDQYIQHTRLVEDQVQTLLTEAQLLLALLLNLENRLDTIHGICVRDNLHTSSSKDEILSTLWTKLGGNRSQLSKFNSQLRLLLQVNTYRQTAFAHVSGTVLKLQAMGAELEELRQRVADPALLRDKVKVPLSVHVENIRLGVERLEGGRGRAREVEDRVLGRAIAGAGAGAGAGSGSAGSGTLQPERGIGF